MAVLNLGVTAHNDLPSSDVSLVLGMTSKPVLFDLRVWAGV